MRRELTITLLKEYYQIIMEIPIDQIIPTVTSRANCIIFLIYPIYWTNRSVLLQHDGMICPTKNLNGTILLPPSYIHWINDLLQLSVQPVMFPMPKESPQSIKTLRGIDMYCIHHVM